MSRIFGGPVAANGMQPRMGTVNPAQQRRPSASPWAVGGAKLQSFGPGNDMVGSSILPTDSRSTTQANGWATKAAGNVAGFQLKPFQGVAPLNLSGSKSMATGANTAMQGLGYNFGAANGQYGAAQAMQGAAASKASGALTGLQSLGTGSFSGGGANLASTAGLNAGLATSNSMVGPKFDYQADVGKARALTSSALESAMTGPERSQLAAENMALLEERSRPGYEKSLRDVTAKNAAMGRRGSGITTNELGDLGLMRERELSLARRESANDAASRTLQDRMDRTTLGLGVTQGFGAEDRGAESTRLAQAGLLSDNASRGFEGEAFNAGQQEAAAGRAASGARFGADFQRGLAMDGYGMARDGAGMAMDIGDRYGTQERDRVGLGERQAGFQAGIGRDLAGYETDEYGAQVRERDTARGDEYDGFGVLNSQFQGLSGYRDGERANDRSNRNELRGERDYQYGLGRDAINDEITRAELEERIRGGRYTRAQGTAQLGFGAPSPAGAYQAAGNQAAGNASELYGAAGGFMEDYFANRGPTGGRQMSRPTGRSARRGAGTGGSSSYLVDREY